MELKRATADDAESILGFWRDSGASPSATDEAEYVRRVAGNPAAVFVVAMIDGEIAGTLVCGRVST